MEIKKRTKMPKKYFYTDPFKAAYMLNEFDIIMYMGNYQEEDYDAYDKGRAFMLVEDYFFRVNSPELFTDWDKKLYIHPDYHEMLKAKVGDTIKISNRAFFVSAHSMGMELGNISVYDVALLYHDIIQRDGKAFFMPEVEENI